MSTRCAARRKRIELGKREFTIKGKNGNGAVETAAFENRRMKIVAILALGNGVCLRGVLPPRFSVLILWSNSPSASRIEEGHFLTVTNFPHKLHTAGASTTRLPSFTSTFRASGQASVGWKQLHQKRLHVMWSGLTSTRRRDSLEAQSASCTSHRLVGAGNLRSFQAYTATSIDLGWRVWRLSGGNFLQNQAFSETTTKAP